MSRKIEWGSDEDFINNYNKLKSSRKMGEIYNCNKTSVLKHAKDIGFDPNKIDRGYKLTEKDKERIINLYESKTSNELAKEYNVSRGMITKIWYDKRLSGKKRTSCKHDLTGKRFSKLTVIDKTTNRDIRGNVMWLCQCDCGNKKEIASADLISGKIKSCGCLSKECLQLGQGLNFKDLTGQKFGKLIVLKRCEDKVIQGRKFVQWICKCSCGRETKVLASNLKNGNTESCGFCGNNSHGNNKISILLDEAKISYEREKRFPDCRDKSLLPFDFYVNNEYLIEYDGIQHFKEEKGLFADYENIHRRDNIKTNWCKENNIPLIRIPYTHYEKLNLEDLLLETTTFLC